MRVLRSYRRHLITAPVAIIFLVAIGLFRPAWSQDSPAYGALSPDRYYQLLAERQRIEISSKQQILVILDAYQGDAVRAYSDLAKHEAERLAKHDALFKKYGVRPEEYYRDIRGTSVLKERSVYLNAHPEVRDQIVSNSRELGKLEAQIALRMAPVWFKSTP